eukprot:739770_1
MDYLPFGLDRTIKYYTQINHLFYAIDHVSNPSHIIGYNLITKHESNTKPMSQYVGLYGCLSSMDDLLFVIGGYDGVALSSTQIYNTSSQNWTIGPPMNKARRYHTCVVDWIDSVLYAIGGWSSTAASTVERISIHMMLLSEANTSWNYIQSLSEGVPAASSLMVPSTHQIFVFFGYSSAPLQIIDCDSGTTASLSEQSTMYGVAALFVSNTIYAFGGREGQETSTCQTMDLFSIYIISVRICIKTLHDWLRRIQQPAVPIRLLTQPAIQRIRLLIQPIIQVRIRLKIQRTIQVQIRPLIQRTIQVQIHHRHRLKRPLLQSQQIPPQERIHRLLVLHDY